MQLLVALDKASDKYKCASFQSFLINERCINGLRGDRQL